MASAMKTEELESFRKTLLGLRSRLRGDLDQMTDEALRREPARGVGQPLEHARCTWPTSAPRTTTRSSPWA